MTSSGRHDLKNLRADLQVGVHKLNQILEAESFTPDQFVPLFELQQAFLHKLTDALSITNNLIAESLQQSQSEVEPQGRSIKDPRSRLLSDDDIGGDEPGSDATVPKPLPDIIGARRSLLFLRARGIVDDVLEPLSAHMTPQMREKAQKLGKAVEWVKGTVLIDMNESAADEISKEIYKKTAGMMHRGSSA